MTEAQLNWLIFKGKNWISQEKNHLNLKVPFYSWDHESVILCLWVIAAFKSSGYFLDLFISCFLPIQDSIITVFDWPFWVTRRWYHSWWGTFYWHRRYTRISDCLLTVGICWEKRAWSCRSNGEQPQNSPGTVTSQVVYRLSRKGMFYSVINEDFNGRAKG